MTTATATPEAPAIIKPAGDVVGTATKLADQSPSLPPSPAVVVPVAPALVAPAALAPVVPAEFKLAIPKDSLLDQADVDRIAADAKARGLTPEQTQFFIDREHSMLAKVSDVYGKLRTDEIAEQGAKWKAETLADPDLGGDNAPATEADVQRALNLLDPKVKQEFVEFSEKTQTGSNRVLVRVLRDFGRLAKPDKMSGGGGAPLGNAVQLPNADVFSPSLAKAQPKQ